MTTAYWLHGLSGLAASEEISEACAAVVTQIATQRAGMLDGRQTSAPFQRGIAATESLDILFRCFSLTRHLPPKELARYTQIDYDRDMAFVAVSFNDDRDEIVGEIRAFRYPDGATAEFTLLVRSDMKRRGLGSVLLEKMIAYCRASGVQEIIGQILPHNEAMIELAQKFGMSVSRHPEASTAVAHLDVRAIKSGKGTHSQGAMSS